MLTPLLNKSGYSRATSSEDVLSTNTGTPSAVDTCANLVAKARTSDSTLDVARSFRQVDHPSLPMS